MRTSMMAGARWATLIGAVWGAGLCGCGGPFPSPPQQSSALGGPTLVVTDYGARGDGVTDDTDAIQNAVNACPVGGTVSLPSGHIFMSGTITLKSDMTFSVESNATLLGVNENTNAPADPQHPKYPLLPPGPPPTWQRLDRSTQPNNNEKDCKRALLYATNVSNLTISGSGTIDGHGSYGPWLSHGQRPGYPWAYTGAYASSPTDGGRPNGIYVTYSKNVTLRDFHFRNSAKWGIVPLEVDGLTIANVSIDSDLPGNRDGFDICDCHNVTMSACTVTSEDDAICLKSGSSYGVRTVLVSDSMVTGSTTANGLKFGTASSGSFTNVRFKNIPIHNVAKAAMAIESVDGASISDVHFETITLDNVGAPFFMILGDRKGSNHIGSIDTVTFTDIQGSANGMDTWGSVFSGTNIGPKTIQNVSFGNVHISVAGRAGPPGWEPPEYPNATHIGYPEVNMWSCGPQPTISSCGTRNPTYDMPAYGIYLRHADAVSFQDVSIAATSSDPRPWLSTHDYALCQGANYSPGSGLCINYIRGVLPDLSAASPPLPRAAVKSVLLGRGINLALYTDKYFRGACTTVTHSDPRFDHSVQTKFPSGMNVLSTLLGRCADTPLPSSTDNPPPAAAAPIQGNSAAVMLCEQAGYGNFCQTYSSSVPDLDQAQSAVGAGKARSLLYPTPVPAGFSASFYEGVNHTGNCLATNTSIDDLGALPDSPAGQTYSFDEKIASIRIGQSCTPATGLLLCSQTGFVGRCQSLPMGSIDDLGPGFVGKKPRSIRVAASSIRAALYTGANLTGDCFNLASNDSLDHLELLLPPGEEIRSAIVDKGCSDTPDLAGGVLLCDGASYGGHCRYLAAGAAAPDLSQPRGLVGRNETLSVVATGNTQVALYTQDHGACVSFRGPVPDLSLLPWNFAHRTWAVVVGQACVAPAGSRYVCTGTGFQERCMAPSSDVGNLDGTFVGNNSVRSIRFAPGSQAPILGLYDQTNFRGHCLEVTADVPDLQTSSFSAVTQSIRVGHGCGTCSGLLITSVSPLVALPNPLLPPGVARPIHIHGCGFGTHAPYTNQDFDFIALNDLTRNNWQGGFVNPGGQCPQCDSITLDVSQWSDNEIIITGFDGQYGRQTFGDWTLRSGDQIKLQVWNANNRQDPPAVMTVPVQ